MMRSSNPALSDKAFRNLESSGSGYMTIQGTVNKSFLSLALLIVGASFTWNLFFETGDPGSVTGLMMVGVIGSLIAAMVTIFKKTAAPITTPIYAVLEGLALGGISAIFEAQYPGVVMQAVGLTFMTLFGLLAAYKSKLIVVTDNFRLGLAAATGGLFLFYMVTFVLGFFGIQFPLFFGNGLFSIGFSVFVVTIAALNLVMDFDFIEKGAEMGAPKYMEWYGAFGLMITMVWLYLEILRLLVKLRNRN